MKVLANLPPDVFRVVVVDWLHLEDIARVDSAVCCRALRTSVLVQLYAIDHSFCRFKKQYSSALEKWIVKKLHCERQVQLFLKVIRHLQHRIELHESSNDYDYIGFLEDSEEIILDDTDEVL
jgi:hypothetical protein